MSNLYRAYAAVHDQEVKQHIAESRDGFSDVSVSGMTSVDLQELAEEVLEYLFSQDLTVNEAFEVVTEMIEDASEGDHSSLRVEKITRIAEGFDDAFDKVTEKSPHIAVEAFLAYRRNKPLAEKWESRVTHEHGNERIHASIIAEERARLLSAIKSTIDEGKVREDEKNKRMSDSAKDPLKKQIAMNRAGRPGIDRIGTAIKSLKDKKEVDADKAKKDAEKRRAKLKKKFGKSINVGMREGYLSIYEKKLDPVGQEDKDIDNDGDHDSTDKYLHKRRKAIGNAMGKKGKCDKCGMKDCECDHSGDIEEGVGMAMDSRTKMKTEGKTVTPRLVRL